MDVTQFCWFWYELVRLKLECAVCGGERQKKQGKASVLKIALDALQTHMIVISSSLWHELVGLEAQCAKNGAISTKQHNNVHGLTKPTLLKGQKWDKNLKWVEQSNGHDLVLLLKVW